MAGRGRVRGWLIPLALAAVPALLVVGLGHTGVHMARSILIPGAGLYDERPLVGAGCTLAATAATVAWIRWGLDWLLAAVVVGSVAVTGILTAGLVHPADPAVGTIGAAPAAAAHEFPLVILVFGAVGWARSVVRSRGPVRRRHHHHDATAPATPAAGLARLDRLAPVDRCRAAAVAAMAASVRPWPPATEAAVIAALDDPAVTTRARRVGLAARARRGGDPLRVDHAHTRAALAGWGRLDPHQLARFERDLRRSRFGAPASEPGWVRLLDGTLAALALSDPTGRWRATMAGPLRLRRGHRPAWVWTPLGGAAGRADTWEHAAATALAFRAGWITATDWEALRPLALGATARATGRRHDLRLIAAGRVWAAAVGDHEATALLARRRVTADPLAAALAALAAPGSPTGGGPVVGGDGRHVPVVSKPMGGGR